MMHHDIILVGAGPVGMSTAIALAQYGFRIALIEKAPLLSLVNPDNDGRGYALSHGTIMIYKTLGIWEYMEKEASPIEKIHVQENNTPFYLHFDASSENYNALGYLVESHILRKALWTKYLDHQDKIQLLSASEISDFHQNDQCVTVKINDLTLTSPLVIAADGRHSEFKKKLCIQSKNFDHGHHALVTRFAHEKPHHHCAFEYFYPQGPFAILPLQGNESSLVWCDYPEKVQELKNKEPHEFASLLYERFPNLGKITTHYPKFSYPLTAILSENLYKGRIALLGDAAQAIHPVAGQGLNLGMRGMAELTELIVKARLHGQDWGDSFVLDTYQKKLFKDRRSMFALTHGLVKLYDIEFKPLTMIRSMGLGLVNKLPPLKRRMMQEAMGAGKDMPLLMQGHSLL
jgi:2-octaprenyl-6-methoxyphenol hydroxylase